MGDPARSGTDTGHRSVRGVTVLKYEGENQLTFVVSRSSRERTTRRLPSMKMFSGISNLVCIGYTVDWVECGKPALTVRSLTS